MNVFVSIIFVILGIGFMVFFVYEIFALVRDIKKYREKKKAKALEDANSNHTTNTDK